VTDYKSSLVYKERIDALVGDRDPLDILSSTISLIQQTLANLPSEQLQSIPSGSWSINDILQHLVDAEMVNGYRLRMVLSAEAPTLPGYNQDFWVERFNLKRSTDAVFSDWKFMRSYNLRIIQTLTPSELNREYKHLERGTETLADLVHLMAGHDLLHFEQIKRLITAL
jgi:uncharacterized damage-inducible protein DinB